MLIEFDVFTIRLLERQSPDGTTKGVIQFVELLDPERTGGEKVETTNVFQGVLVPDKLDSLSAGLKGLADKLRADNAPSAVHVPKLVPGENLHKH